MMRYAYYLIDNVPMHKMKCIQIVIAIVLLFSVNNTSLARGNIVDYYLKNPKAWDETKKILRKVPIKIVVTGGLKGLGFDLTELSGGDEVALIFLETQKAVKLKWNGF